ncbi:Plasma membrane protein [Phytophthora megakarya]|uniref:Plasma membrane protein n=1 Tax=Phytophthora megakarya TaxID=4795 RepID=A0A225WGV6_9STRA|nr:Plasma membrane protein [Phytophthora megakarya]
MDEHLVSGGIMLLICLGMTIVMQCSFFVMAYTCQFDKVTDLAGALNFVVLAVLSLVLQNVFDPRAIVLTCLQVVWALRLGSFLLIRVLKRGKDERFDEMRANCMAFFGFWVFQILWVFLVSFPVILANSCNKIDNFGEPRDYVGIALWAIGMMVENAADTSKSAFNDNPKNKGKLLRSGVWKYSRHPNYFGEILCWVGVTITASANFKGGETWFYVSCISPVFTFLVLMFLSGVPLAEDRYDERFGLDPDYIEYKSSTSPLIMLPPTIYRWMPDSIKRWCFLELKRYSRKLHEVRNTEQKVPPTNYQAIS